MRRSIPTINIQRHDSPASSAPDRVPPAPLSAPAGPLPGRLRATIPIGVAPPANDAPATVAELIQTGKGFLLIDRHEMALPYFQQAVAADPENGDAWLELGRCYHKSERYKEAEDALIRATRLLPDNAQAYVDLGEAYYHLEHWQHAIITNRLALRIDPDYALAYNNLGLAYNAMGRYQEAIEAFEQAIRLLPGEPNIMKHFMSACRNLGRVAPVIR